MLHHPTLRASALSFAVTAALSAAAVAAAADAPRNLLLNGGAEQGKADQPSAWGAAAVPADGLKLARDLEQKKAGNASLLVANTHDYGKPVSNNWSQNLQNVPAGKTLVVSG